MSTNHQRPRNRFVNGNPYHEALVADAQKHWRWSEWQLAKLRVDRGNAPINHNEEEIIKWHQCNPTTR
jgi:hypothetical protein